VSGRKKSPGQISIYLTDRAKSDLLEIEAFSIASWGKVVSAKYVLKFEKAFRLLQTSPGLAHAFPKLGNDLLFHRVEKHLLACVRIKQWLVVLTFCQTSREYESVLGDLIPTLRLEVKALMRKLGRL
jgi:plasmid stabilization system protein ParE